MREIDPYEWDSKKKLAESLISFGITLPAYKLLEDNGIVIPKTELSPFAKVALANEESLVMAAQQQKREAQMRRAAELEGPKMPPASKEATPPREDDDGAGSVDDLVQSLLASPVDISDAGGIATPFAEDVLMAEAGAQSELQAQATSAASGEGLKAPTAAESPIEVGLKATTRRLARG
jgi:hypothetical protein